MSDLNSILLTVILILGGILLITMVYVLLRAVKAISLLQNEITNLNKSFIPLIERMNSLTKNAESALEVFTQYKDSLGESVENIRAVTRNVYRLEEILHKQIEPSLIEFASFLSGIRKGIRAFVDNWRRSH